MAYKTASFSIISVFANSFCASSAPLRRQSMFIPATAIGSKPTAVRTEYLPPISSGTINVSYPSFSDKFFNAPLLLSVVANTLDLALSFPYLLSSKSLRTLKAIAGSVVVPDFDITFMEKSLSFKNSVSSAK